MLTSAQEYFQMYVRQCLPLAKKKKKDGRFAFAYSFYDFNVN